MGDSAVPITALSTPGTQITAKWGSALKAGFQVVPNVLIRAQSTLGLDAVDVLVLLNLTLHWWGPEDWPYPRPTIIANRMGVSKRTVERRLEKLQKAGFIERMRTPPVRRPGVAKVKRYRLTGLVERLQAAAAVNLTQRDGGSE